MKLLALLALLSTWALVVYPLAWLAFIAAIIATFAGLWLVATLRARRATRRALQTREAQA